MKRIVTIGVPPLVRALVLSRGALPIASIGIVFLLLGACSPHRDVGKDRVLKAGTHQWGSAIDSDSYVPSGALLHLDYAANSRIYLAEGGTLRGLARGSHNCSIIYERGAHFPRGCGLRLFNTKDAELSFANRGQDSRSVGIIASDPDSRTENSWEDEVEVDCDPPSRSPSSDDVRISSSSYEKRTP